MKKLCFSIFVLLVANFSLIANQGYDLSISKIYYEKGTLINEDFKDILIPHVDLLSKESIFSGQQVGTNKILYDFNGCFQACYINGTVETQIFTPLSQNQNLSKQTVCLKSDLCYEIISESENWAVKEIEGEKFIVHQHDGFKVYTNSKRQFILADNK